MPGPQNWLLCGCSVPSIAQSAIAGATERLLLTARVLAHRFHTTIMRTAHNLQLALDGVPVQDVQFQSRR